jgi:hypothetical protein
VQRFDASTELSCDTTDAERAMGLLPEQDK